MDREVIKIWDIIGTEIGIGIGIGLGIAIAIAAAWQHKVGRRRSRGIHPHTSVHRSIHPSVHTLIRRDSDLILVQVAQAHAGLAGLSDLPPSELEHVSGQSRLDPDPIQTYKVPMRGCKWCSPASKFYSSVVPAYSPRSLLGTIAADGDKRRGRNIDDRSRRLHDASTLQVTQFCTEYKYSARMIALVTSSSLIVLSHGASELASRMTGNSRGLEKLQLFQAWYSLLGSSRHLTLAGTVDTKAVRFYISTSSNYDRMWSWRHS